MNDNDPGSRSTRSREPWNKGKLIGPKPPLRPSHVWSIRTKLQLEGRTRDLALFNLAIDSKLRGCDVVAVRVDDVAPNGYSLDRATVRQKETGRPVRFELTEQNAPSSRRISAPVPEEARRVLVRRARWLRTRADDPAICAPCRRVGCQHRSRPVLRRTKATLIYRRTGNLRAVQLLLETTAYCPRTPGRRANLL